MLDKFYEICKFIVCLCGTILIVLFTVASIYIALKQGDKRKMTVYKFTSIDRTLDFIKSLIVEGKWQVSIKTFYKEYPWET